MGYFTHLCYKCGLTSRASGACRWRGCSGDVGGGAGAGCKLPRLEFGAVIVEVAEDTVFGVGIQPEPCCRGSVIHNKPLVVVKVIKNLADAWRIRICSLTESLICSIQQVDRFSIYQEPQPRGARPHPCLPSRRVHAVDGPTPVPCARQMQIRD